MEVAIKKNLKVIYKIKVKIMKNRINKDQHPVNQF